jgi:hypothetical protein
VSRLVPRPLSPPTPELTDFSVSIQNNLEEIFGVAHEHGVRSTAPGATDGSIGDVFPVFDGSTYKLYVKFSTGWKSVQLS